MSALMAETFRTVPVRPSQTLADLRDTVLEINAHKKPVWRFILAPDLVLVVQPVEQSQFDCAAVMGEDAVARGALIKPSLMSGDLRFRLVAAADDDWTIEPRSVSASKGSTVRDRIVATFADNCFDRLDARKLISETCLVCGRALADPESKARLVGPECFRQMRRPLPHWRTEDARLVLARAATSGPLKPKPSLTLVTHCLVYGRLETAIRDYKIGNVEPRAQHKTSVAVSFVEPGKRKWMYVTAIPTGGRYHTIERDGVVTWDSRDVVPIDMEAFERSRAESAERRPFVTVIERPHDGARQ